MATQYDATQFDAGDTQVKFSDLFEFQRVLGNGSFGVVVAALQKPYMKECAVKIIMKKSLRNKNLESFWKESQILQQLDHPNIVKFIGINESETRIFIIMELAKGGQLQHMIQERTKAGKPLSDEEAATVMRSIYAGLRYIHLKDIVHRDLKPENILLNDKNDLSSVKICDFGLSAQYNTATCTRSFNEKCGTDIFMAPELWKKKRYSKPVDMWSCGIIMYMLLSGGKHPLYKHGDNQESYFKKLEGAQWPLLPNFNKYSKDLFLKSVLEEPCERYTVEQVQDHPWITRRFDKDIPLTSSEKIAAFSHSQSLSRILKSIYLIYSVPEAIHSKQKSAEKTPESAGSDKHQAVTTTDHSGSKSSHKSSKSEEETCHGFGSSDNSIKIPIIEEEHDASLEANNHSDRNNNTFDVDIVPKLRLPHTPLIGRDSATPTPITGSLARKAAPSFTQVSTAKSNLRPLQSRRDNKDYSAIGSLAELETTNGSNPGSQQDDKTTKQYIPSTSELAVHTEPSKTAEDEKKDNAGNTTLWGLDKIGYGSGSGSGSASFGRRRDSKSNRIPDEYVNGRLQSRDASSIDFGNRSGSKTSAGKARNVEAIDNGATFGSVGPKIPTSLHNADHFNTTRNIASIVSLVTPAGNKAQEGSEMRNAHVLSDKKYDSEVSRKQLMKNKMKKENVDTGAALPNLGKIKQRQNSLSFKKKSGSSNKEKTVGKIIDGQKSFNIAGSGRSTALSGEGPIGRQTLEERRLDLTCKKIFEENRLETKQDSKRTTPQPVVPIVACRTPMKENKEEAGTLPAIKQESRKTKLSWVNSSERGLSQKKAGVLGNMTPVFHRPGAKAIKVVTPLKYNKE